MTKIAMTMVIGLSLIGGCKKKPVDGDKTGSGSDMGSSMMGSGSSMAGSGSGSSMAGSGSSAEAPKPKTGAELADAYKACGQLINDGKFDDFRKTCVDDAYVGHEGSQTQKADELVGMFQGMKTAIPDFKIAPQVILVNGQNVFGVGLITGTHSGVMKMPGMPDIPATNKKVGMLMFHRLKFNDANKASEEWAFSDMTTMMFQLGLTPKEAGAHRAAMDKGMDGAPMVIIAADDAKEKANLEVIKKSNDAFSAHKIADVMALDTDDIVESDQSSEKDVTGKKEVEKGLKEFLGAFSDGKLANPEMFAGGDYVVSIANFEGTNDHDMGEMKKTGKKVSVPVAEINQLKDGKVSKTWRFFNSMEFAIQMGMMQAPGGGSAAAPAGSAAAPAGSAAAPAGSGTSASDKK